MLRSFSLCITLLATCLCLVSSTAFSAEEAVDPFQRNSERIVRWDLSADSVVSHNDSEIMEAKGNVFLRRGEEYLKADFARYYSSTKWVYLSGNVVVRMGRDEISASEAEFDLRSRVGWLKNGTIFMAGPHAYIKGDRIEKHWGDIYTFSNAKITTCDGDNPAWSITSDEATVEVDGYAHMRGSKLQVRDTPVFYTPFFLFPTKTKRQSGLLRPEFGISNRKGFHYDQPFFWAIDDSNDMTFNLNFMEKRGVMPGIEYRTRPTSTTSGWIRFDWMHDKVTTDRVNSGAFDDGYRRTNPERYWIRGMYDSKLNDREWRIKADLDYVSDQHFLSEFNNGLSGFSRSRDELFDIFSRDLQEKSSHRKSGILFTRDWERFSANLSSIYTQNQYLGNGNRLHRSDENVQRLPQFDAFLHKGRIFPSFPLEADASLQAAYMYRRNGTRGARYMAVPRLTLPLSSRYGSIIASGGVSQTLYNTENPSHNINFASLDERTKGPRQEEESRTVPFFDIAAATELARVYDFAKAPLPLTNSTVGNSQWLGMRHSVQPRLEYVYRPHVNQRDNPYYDDEDRLTPKTELVYSITNVLTRKQESVVLVKNDKGEMVPTPKITYTDLARLRLEQAYDHREASRTDHRDKYDRRPFGDVIADLEVQLTPALALNTRNNWSPYTNDFTRHQSTLHLSDPDLGSFYLGYDYRAKIDEYTRYRNDSLSFIRVGGGTSIGPFSATANFYYDYKNSDNHEIDMSLSYNHQCFTLIGSTLIDPREESYQLSIVLTGLGE